MLVRPEVPDEEKAPWLDEFNTAPAAKTIPAAATIIITDKVCIAGGSDLTRLHIRHFPKGITNLPKYLEANPSVQVAMDGPHYDAPNGNYVATGLLIEGGQMISKPSWTRPDKQDEYAWYGVFYVENNVPHVLDSIGFKKKFGNDFSSISFAVECGPVLVSGSHVFSGDDARKCQRSALFIAEGKTWMVSTKKGNDMAQGEFANFLKSLGAEYALAMDGGNSTKWAAQSNTGTDANPGRKVSHLITWELIL